MPKLASNCVRLAVVGESRRASRCWIKRRGKEPARSAVDFTDRVPDRVSGARVFIGTRVPVAALFENIEGGASIHEFLEWFPGVTAQQARSVLEHAAKSLEVA